MNPQQESKARALGQPTFLQRNMSFGRRLHNFGADVASMTGKGVGLVGETIDKGLGLPGRVATGFNPAVPQGFSEQVGEAVGQSSGNRNLGAVAGFAASIASPGIGGGEAQAAKKAFAGFQDLSTKVLERNMKDRISVSYQYVKDALKSTDVKEAERKVFEDVLQEYQGAKSVPVQELADKIKTNLLPLKPVNLSESAAEASGMAPKYSRVNLPDEQRGINYTERVYESPIDTFAGNVHFSGKTKNYFGHTRIEDIAEPAKGEFRSLDDALQAGKEKDFTRRIVEVQSDLFQRGRLENEVGGSGYAKLLSPDEWKEYTDLNSSQKIKNVAERARSDELQNKAKQMREAEVGKLSPYRNTFWERLIKEEVKQAANDGAKKIQLPAGTTAMKIEGLGTNNGFVPVENGSALPRVLSVSDLGVGKTIRGGAVGNDDWVVTDVLDDGKFKAIKLHVLERLKERVKNEDGREFTNPREYIEYARKDGFDYDQDVEGFDISGKVDEANPIYKFYEKDVGKFMKNKYGAELVTDKFGNQWWEAPITSKLKDMPVEAFGVIGAVGLGAAASQNQNQNQRTLQ